MIEYAQLLVSLFTHATFTIPLMVVTITGMFIHSCNLTERLKHQQRVDELTHATVMDHKQLAARNTSCSD